MADNLRLNHERRLVAQICPGWNRLQQWFELAEAFRSAAWSVGQQFTFMALTRRRHEPPGAAAGEPDFHQWEPDCQLAQAG
jgi:hypothetical protein